MFTNVFMSDMADEFFHAWIRVMEPPKMRLFCSWHVDRAWRKNLSKIKGGKEKQIAVYKIIRTFLEERDQTAFEKMFEEALKSFKNDPDTVDFGEYFSKEYSSSARSWAYCFRQHAGLNTNMHLERMHGVLKHIYLKGKKPQRLDIALHALMRFLRDKVFDRLIHLYKGKLTPKMSLIRQRHASSIKLNGTKYVQSEDDTWKILSSQINEIYEVKKVNDSCNCDLKCEDCKICIHTYVCTCPDSAIKFNMCKHIHFINNAIINEKIREEMEDSEENVLYINEESNDCDLQRTIMKELQDANKIESSNNIEKQKELLLNQFKILLKEANSADELDIIQKFIRKGQTTIQAHKSRSAINVEHSFECKEPTSRKRKFEPQRKFKSTKKPRQKTSASIVVPTTKEKDEIAINLIHGTSQNDAECRFHKDS